MQEIRQHLSKGRTAGELIGMGFAPGTVYRIQREFRRSYQTIPDVPDLTGHLSIFRDKDDLSVVWHPESQVKCPDCGEEVSHWRLCVHCNNLIPEGCECPTNSPAFTEGFSFQDVFNSTKV